MKAAYVVLGVSVDGQKEVLGIWVCANESSKYMFLNEVCQKNQNVKPNPLLLEIDDLHLS